MSTTQAFSIIGLLLLLAGLFFLAINLRPTTIFDFERGLLYQNGRFRRLLGPGTYWTLRQWRVVTKVDMRSRRVTLSGQEVLSADNLGLKITLVAGYKVEDPFTAINENVNFLESLYLLLQISLRDLVGALPVDDLLAQRAEIGRKLLENCAAAALKSGVRLEMVAVKDIMFPGELKAVFAQVVNARKEGQAALERARGETAALRNLANAADLLEKQPGLFKLRLLQTLGSGTGNTILLKLGNDEIDLAPTDKEKHHSKKTEKA